MNYVGNHFTDNVGKKRKISKLIGITGSSGISPDKLFVLLILCLQNSLFTVLRRYSQGILKENYSKHEVLLFGEVIKMSFTAFVIYRTRKDGWPFCNHILFLVKKSLKMVSFNGDLIISSKFVSYEVNHIIRVYKSNISCYTS